jgi:hypothetical protein
MNPKMKCLTLPSIRYLTDMDLALAELARSSTSRLEELQLWGPVRIKGMEKGNLPLFLDALRQNFTIQTIGLNQDRNINQLDIPVDTDRDDLAQSDLQDPWDDDLVLAIETVPLLNRAGRCYMKDALTDQVVGFEVLERVNDDLDCIFYHVRENPSLCWRHILLVNLGVRKRTPKLPISVSKRTKYESLDQL